MKVQCCILEYCEIFCVYWWFDFICGFMHTICSFKFIGRHPGFDVLVHFIHYCILKISITL